MNDRLPPPAGRMIDRDRPVRFRFDGREYDGFHGDTVASALWANGRRVLSRSFKYHRPRGPVSFAGHEANTLVQVGDEPIVFADKVPITPDLDVSSINTAGSLDSDLLAVLDRLGRFLPAGFYYKTFFRKPLVWRFWEPKLRRLAGLGAVVTDAEYGHGDKQHLFADVAVIGGGPAGRAAATAAAAQGADVILVDDAARGPDPAGDRITVMTGTTCTGAFADGWLSLVRGERLFKLRSAAMVLATGDIVQPVVFRHNDLPGILTAQGAERLIDWYGVRPGRRAVVISADDRGYRGALSLHQAGVDVAAMLDLRGSPGDDPAVSAVADLRIAVRSRATITEAVAGRDKCVTAVIADGATFDCDLVVMSGGAMPAAALAGHAGGRMSGSARGFRVTEVPDWIELAGAVAGHDRHEDAVEDGRRAGLRAAATAGFGTDRPAAEPPADRPVHPWPIFPHQKGKEFVDLDEDVTVKDVRDAVAEGYDHIELAKRFTTATMGPAQGRLSLLAAARLVADATGQDAAAVGATTARPPAAPESFAQLAGRPHHPVRRTAMHHRHLEAGARMMPAGPWLRPAFYGAAAERDRCIRNEVLRVRESVGLIDVSTLGGLEIRGPDAAEFMNRIYTFAYAKQPVGRVRYVLMCDQTGVIIDDGVACRLDQDHFYVTATTTGVDAAYRQMLWFNAQWRLKVDIANVTAAYAVVNIAGPRSRELLAPLCPDLDLSSDAFPYLGVRTGAVAGISARLLRIGFVGELGYEIHVPAPAGEALWDSLVAADSAVAPFGVEAQRQLRLEKGHIIVGQDTDGLTHPAEADMAWAISRNKPFFVGARAIDILDRRPLKRKLVGFELIEPDAPIPQECHLVVRGDEITGRVTSVGASPVLDRVVGLAYVAPDQAAPDGRFTIKVDGGALVEARVVKPPFYDPDGDRQAR